MHLRHPETSAMAAKGSKRTCGGAVAGPQCFRTSSQPLDDGSQPEAEVIDAMSASAAYDTKGRKPDLSCVCEGSVPDRQKRPFKPWQSETHMLRCAPRSAKRSSWTLQS